MYVISLEKIGDRKVMKTLHCMYTRVFSTAIRSKWNNYIENVAVSLFSDLPSI